LSGLHRQPLDMLRKAGFIEVIGRENLCARFDAALSRAKALLRIRIDNRTGYRLEVPHR
jgi:hypothetical protein